MNSYTVDNTWYTDTGATDHITGELEKLAVREKYNGGDEIHTASGAGMNIRHIGHSTIRTLLVILNFVTFFMFLPPKRISFQFIASHPIIMFFLSFTQTSFL
jgi:hypothetical protein